jgi:hypothetical protein
MSTRSVAAILVTFLLSNSPAVGQIFTDGLESGANWTVAMDSDSSAMFGYDYSQKGVPAAPNGADTIGLKLEVNNSAPAEIDQIVAAHFDEAFTGQYTFRVDVWANWAPVGGSVGTGTTEFTGVSVGHDGLEPGPFGASFLYTGDGDAADTDYRLYKDETQLQAESGQYALGTEAGARDHLNPVIMEAFPEIDIATAAPTQGTTGTVRAGAGGFQWMTINVEVDTDAIGPAGTTTDAGFARISMRSENSGNTLAIGTIDNSNDDTVPTVLGGSIAVLMSDLFSSVTVDPTYSFGLFDNVQVFEGLVPLPMDEGLAGDYNGDNVVDLADYTVWRDSLGASGDDLAADGDGSGTIDEGDYTEWKNSFGESLDSSAGVLGQPVPEPCAGWLMVAAVAASAIYRWPSRLRR